MNQPSRRRRGSWLRGAILLAIVCSVVGCDAPERRVVEWRSLGAEAPTLRLGDDEGRLEISDQPHRVTLGEVARVGTVQGMGETVVRPLPSLESVSALEFFFGSNAGSGQNLRVRVDVRDADGDISRWYERSFRASERGQWQRVEIPVDGLRQRPAPELLFSAQTDQASSVDRVIWGDVVALADESPGDARPNVLLIILDTLRADRMSLYGAPRPTTPFLDQWAAREAVVFEQVVASAPWTLPATTSLLTGLDAVRHGVNHQARVPAQLRLLPEVLRDAGYRTGAVTAGGYLLPEFGFDQGFDSFDVWQGDPAKELTRNLRRTRDWLGDHADERFFFLLQTYEIHGPHRRRQPYFDAFAPPNVRALDGVTVHLQGHDWEQGNLQWVHDTFRLEGRQKPGSAPLSKDERELIRTMYDSAIAYTDRSLEDLFAELKQLGIYDETLIVITSDHGEALGEGGRAGHNYLDDFNLMVPLVIRFPEGVGGGTRIAAQVRQIDIAPTVLAAIGEDPSESLPGTDGRPLLSSLDAEDPAFGRPRDTEARGPANVPPAEAWAYAASANGGLALRYGGRWKARIQNTAADRLIGKKTFEPILGQRRTAGDLQKTKERARSYLEASSTGLGIDIENRTASWRLSSKLPPWGGVARVKSWSFDCRCASWEDGRYRVTLPPQKTLSLTVEEFRDEQVVLQVGVRERGTGREGTWTRLEASRDEFADGSYAWSFQPGAGWRVVSPDRATADGEIRLTVGFRGETGAVDAASIDDEARQQLEALGYL